MESEVDEKAESNTGGSVRRAFWLAEQDVRRTWISYPATCLGILLLGFLAIGPVHGVFELGGFGSREETLQEGWNGFFADFFFLCVCPSLGINFVLNSDYGARYRHNNKMSRRLAFVRGLPISAGEIVAGRALTMLPALAVAVLAFFLPLFVIPAEPVGRLGAVGYWSFASIWVGYALFAAGLYLYAWLGFSGREDVKGMVGLLVGFLLAAVVCNFVFGIHLVAGSIGLAREYGPLAAVPALLIGAAGFALWCLATTRRLQRRDLSA